MTAVVMTAVIGMAALVMDVGGVMIDRHRLRNAVDAAALAGAQELPGDPEEAEARALAYAAMNGAVRERTMVIIDEDLHGIRVTSGQTVSYGFARLFGHLDKEVSQSAHVRLGSATTACSGIRPFAVEWGSFQYGERVTLKEGAGDGTTGNYGAVALGLRGADSFKDNVKYGYDGEIRVGDLIDTEPGNMSGPTIDGVNQILGSDNATFDDFSKDSDRLWIIPVVESFDALGRDQILVSGFAAFFVEDTELVDNAAVVIGRFLEFTINADFDEAQSYHGVSGLKLME